MKTFATAHATKNLRKMLNARQHFEFLKRDLANFFLKDVKQYKNAMSNIRCPPKVNIEMIRQIFLKYTDSSWGHFISRLCPKQRRGVKWVI